MLPTLGLWTLLSVVTCMTDLWAAVQMGCAQGRHSGIELGYVVWCYTVEWLNATSVPEGSGIEYNTSIMGLCLECTTSVRCDLGTVFPLQWGCLCKNRNKNCQFLLVCKLELYKCVLCYCVLLLWYQSFLMSLFPIGLSMLVLLPVWISFLYCCM